jgi:Cu+-exporting ATPase
VAEAERRGLTVPSASDFTSHAGRGVEARLEGATLVVGSARLLRDLAIDPGPLEAEATSRAENGETPVFVARDGRAVAVVTIADPVRTEAHEAIAEARRRGLRVAMVSGDAWGVARAVARQVGIDDVTAEVLPEGKRELVRVLQGQGRRVAMVGDGINDAPPALAQADLGIAIGTGTDVAIEASDVTLVGDDPRSVVSALELSRRTMRIVRENLFWAFAYNVLLIPVAMGVLYPFFGILLDPALAAAAMALSSVTVVANALRLRRFDARPSAIA